MQNPRERPREEVLRYRSADTDFRNITHEQGPTYSNNVQCFYFHFELLVEMYLMCDRKAMFESDYESNYTLG